MKPGGMQVPIPNSEGKRPIQRFRRGSKQCRTAERIGKGLCAHVIPGGGATAVAVACCDFRRRFGH